MANQEMPIFTRTFDFLTWLLPATNNFPRAHRNSATKRLLDAAFNLRERLEEANIRKDAARQERLERADEALSLVRLYLRLAVKWKWLSDGQYQHVSAMVAEIGRLLGGWKKNASGKQQEARNHRDIFAVCSLLFEAGHISEVRLAFRDVAKLENRQAQVGLHPPLKAILLKPFLKRREPKISLACLGIILYCKKKQRRFLQKEPHEPHGHAREY